MQARDDQATVETKTAGRRGFLKLAGVGTVGGAAAAIVGAPDAQASTLAPGANSAGYRETAHVKKVYDLSKF